MDSPTEDATVLLLVFCYRNLPAGAFRFSHSLSQMLRLVAHTDSAIAES